MEDVSLNRYTKLLSPLSPELKLRLIEWLLKSLRLEITPQEPIPEEKDEKELRLRKLVGTWADVDDTIIEDIYSSRSVSDKTLFDED